MGGMQRAALAARPAGVFCFRRMVFPIMVRAELKHSTD
jgi:hypothetical protein